jgi:multisubunit Na+/H+ antiporter MnhF subunit
MSESWLLASIAILPSVLVAIVAAGTGAIGPRLVAVELATSLALILLITLSFAFDQPSSIDLAVSLALLTLPGTLILALFQERWL